MAGLGSARTAALDVEIYDGDRVTPEARMYDSAPAASATLRSSVQQISIAGHRWTLRISLLPGKSARADRALMIAGFGLVGAAARRQGRRISLPKLPPE